MCIRAPRTRLASSYTDDTPFCSMLYPMASFGFAQIELAPHSEEYMYSSDFTILAIHCMKTAKIQTGMHSTVTEQMDCSGLLF